MISNKPWRLDAMLWLGAGLMLSIWTGALLRLALQRWLPTANGELSFLGFVVSTVTFQGVGIVLISYFLKLHLFSWRELLGGLGLEWKRAVQWAAGVSVVAIPSTLALNYACSKLILLFERQPKEQMVMQVLQNTAGWGQRVTFAITAVLLAPVVEEILFRGILYPWIKQRGYPMLALAGTSLLFAAIHGNLLTFLPLTFLAMCFVYVYEKTDAMLAPILAHAMFNLVNLVLALVPWQKVLQTLE